MNSIDMLHLQTLIPAILAITFISFILHHLTSKPKHRRRPPSPPSLPIIGHLHHIGPLIHQSLHHLSTRYGPLILLRLGSIPCFVASTPDLAHDFLKTNDLDFAYRKTSLAIDHITYGVGFAVAPYGPYWKFIKKVSMVELLGVQNVSRFLPIRKQEIHELVETLVAKSRRNESVNMTEEFIKLTNNVICQMMMGIRCSGSNSEADVAKNLARKVTEIFEEFNVSDFVWFCRSIDLQGFRKRYVEINSRYDGLMERIICEREEMRRRGVKGEDEGKGKDFLDLLLDILEDEKAEVKLTRNHIKATILDFFVAGTDTSATTLEWTLAELINNPTVLEKARHEIDTVIGNKRLVEETDAPNLPYVQAIIKESLRLHPPVALLIRKSNGNVTIQGYDIPAGSLLYVNIWSIGRNPDCWENPLQFNPERFMEGDTLKSGLDIKGQNFQLLPFGTGRRVCPGVNIAMRQTQVVLATLIQCFEWNVKDNQPLDMEERGGLTVPRAQDLVCLPSLRQNCPLV